MQRSPREQETATSMTKLRRGGRNGWVHVQNIEKETFLFWLKMEHFRSVRRGRETWRRAIEKKDGRSGYKTWNEVRCLTLNRSERWKHVCASQEVPLYMRRKSGLLKVGLKMACFWLNKCNCENIFFFGVYVMAGKLLEIMSNVH